MGLLIKYNDTIIVSNALRRDDGYMTATREKRTTRRGHRSQRRDGSPVVSENIQEINQHKFVSFRQGENKAVGFLINPIKIKDRLKQFRWIKSCFAAQPP